jgi:hypothetical protein
MCNRAARPSGASRKRQPQRGGGAERRRQFDAG